MLSFTRVKKALEKIWHSKAPYFIFANNNLFYSRFTDEEDRAMVLEGPPIFIDDKFFAMSP